MLSFFTAAAFGASLVSAVPLSSAPFPSASTPSGSLSTGSANTLMRQSPNAGIPITIVGNDFPNKDQLAAIEAQAHGDLSNAAPPPPGGLSPDTLTTLQLLNFGEEIESVFFTTLLNNVTSDVSGYTFENRGVKAFIENALINIKNQEELHAINAINAITAVFGANNVIEPCRYQFPTSNFGDSISFASRLTDAVEGVIQDFIFQAASNGNAALTPGLASALGNEGEQNGWFRSLMGLRPSELPFLTRNIRDFAYSALQDLIVPGSCPNQQLINLTIFQPMTAPDPPAKTTDLEFTVPLNNPRFIPQGAKTVDTDIVSVYGDGSWKTELFVTYINQQDLPVSTPVKEFTVKGETLTLIAEFPFDTVNNQQMFGLTIATLTNKNNLQTIEEMRDATLRGPVFLETVESSFGRQYN